MKIGRKKLSTNSQLESSRVLAESDSEGVTSSPSKNQSTTSVPYCKTYEEIRLEEIQAESAAYYSYEQSSSSSSTTTTGAGAVVPSSLYQQQPGGGKDKKPSVIRTIRKTSLYSRDKIGQIKQENKTINTSGDLSFKILTLDEIRKRKNESLVDDKFINNSSDITKSAIITLDKVKTSSDTNKILSRKRNFDDSNENTDNINVCNEKKCKIDKLSLVPPVRLRRTKINDEDCKISGKIEVRLCDSSTDDINNQKIIVSSLENIQNDNDKKINIDESIDDLKIDQFIDGHSNDHFQDESDDVLKDIDALLD